MPRTYNDENAIYAPATRHFAITPDDDTDLEATEAQPRALYIGTGGTLSMTDEVGAIVIYTVSDGQVIPFRPVRVRATGTTATGIIGWY